MSHYNEIAGQNLGRLAALSDGIFAVGMTLLVLDITVPAAASVHGHAELITALVALLPKLGVYIMSFLTLGIFWVGQQTQLNYLASCNRNLAWLHMLFLFFVTLMPFSTGLIGAFLAERAALVIYWANILALGAALFAAWRYACARNLIKPEIPAAMMRGIERRIIIAQALYAFGAALCIFSTIWSLGFIVLVQLNYVFAPRILSLHKI